MASMMRYFRKIAQFEKETGPSKDLSRLPNLLFGFLISAFGSSNAK